MTKVMTIMTIIRSYSELKRLDSFEERYDYLRLKGVVGEATFGFDRHINQALYQSNEWRNARRKAIIRDNGCDLGVFGYEIYGEILVHHMNPITVDDIVNRAELVLDPEFLITTTMNTHNAIHYGDQTLLRTPFVERIPGDTKLW
jgi:hypothetical protein